MKKYILMGGVLLFAFALSANFTFAVKPANTPAPKVAICHFDKDAGTYHLINVSENAQPAHLAHGDGFPGTGSLGDKFTATCEVVTMPTVPEITSPANNSVLTTAQLTEIDWTASTGTYTPMDYQYQAFSDAAYTVPVYSSGWFTDSKIPTPGTPAGNYYVQVRARDSVGNLTEWSNGELDPYLITVKNLIHVTSGTLNYGPTGWAGWSCPAGTTVVDGSLVVGGGDLASTFVWKTGATTGTVNYPDTPFGYTYGSGETGFIGQNDNDSGESIVFDFDCMPNL